MKRPVYSLLLVVTFLREFQFNTGKKSTITLTERRRQLIGLCTVDGALREPISHECRTLEER